LKGLGAMSPEERKTEGAKINALRDRVSGALDAEEIRAERKSDLRRSSPRIPLPTSRSPFARRPPSRAAFIRSARSSTN
jgi:phenylalanyl-tRNA synthetase alpha chain